MARSRPKIEDLDDGVQHSYDHRGDTGMYGTIYKEEVERWRKISAADHELCIVPYLCRENSMFRMKNPDFNKPFDDGKLEDGRAWAHKLTALLHYSIGVNKDTGVCPRTYKADCPVCEKRNAIFDLIDKETDKDKAQMLQKQADDLKPAKRAIYNVFVFDSEKEMQKGVQVWEAPHESMEDVLSDLYVDKRTGEKRYYTIPEEKWNVRFERIGSDKENTKYRKVEIVKRLDKDEFTDKELDQLYSMAYNLDEIVEIKDYDEWKILISGIEDGEKGESEEREDRSESRFRGDRKRSEESEGNGKPSRMEKRDEPPPDREPPQEGAIPDKYADCFGTMNGQRDECEKCPKDVWKDCFQKSEEAKQPKRAARTGNRVGGRKALD